MDVKRKKRFFHFLMKNIRFAVNFAAIVAAVATFLGFLAEQWWIFKLLDHLRVQLSLILLLALLFNGLKYRFWSLAFSLPLFLNFLLILPTWLAGLPPFMMIAIDHGIYSKGIVTLDRKIGQTLGSDHLPPSLKITLAS